MRPYRTLGIKGLGFILALCIVSCHSTPKEREKTEAQKIVDDFKAKVDRDLQEHKSRKDVWAQNGDQYVEAGWYMEDDELPASSSINVEKTDSLVSPYVGTAEFPVAGQISYPKNSRQEALDATEFKNSDAVDHRLLYAYQNGHWILKSEECFDYDYSTEMNRWGDCKPSSHGAHLPLMNIP